MKIVWLESEGDKEAIGKVSQSFEFRGKFKMTLKQRIGKQNQATGHRFEILTWRKIKHKQTIARAISSGSKGLIDVWALERDKLRVILCKTNGYLDPKERRDIHRFMREKAPWVQVELWFYKSKRKVSKLHLTQDWEIRYSLLLKKLQCVK